MRFPPLHARHWLLGLVVLLAPCVSQGGERKEVRVLTIGNSFAQNALSYLSDMAKSDGKTLLSGRANLGGATMERHVTSLQASLANPDDPQGRPYRNCFQPERPPEKPYSLIELLQAERWDYVTIQQASIKSFDEASYQPYADILIETIHKYAPQAKILIHQTWAYREDYPGFKNGFTQEKMYEGLRACYAKLAEKHHLEIIPVGDAFQLARKEPMWDFRYPDASFDYRSPPEGETPQQPNSLIIGWTWRKNEKTGSIRFVQDIKHANEAGRYLAGAVWYEMLFEDDVETISFVPRNLDPVRAQNLREMASKAIELMLKNGETKSHASR